MSDKEDDPVLLDFGKKKKKKDKKEKKEKKDKDDDGETAEKATMVETAFEKGRQWSYDDLLSRLHETMSTKSAVQLKDKFTLATPKVVRCGSKKTAWVNFEEICNLLKRSKDHLMQYTFAELGCEGTMAGEGQFVMKGKFVNRHIESLLKKYIREYVQCSLCKSAKTELSRDQGSRLFMLNCLNCNATRSCQNISKGFLAKKKGERKRARVAENLHQVRA